MGGEVSGRVVGDRGDYLIVFFSFAGVLWAATPDKSPSQLLFGTASKERRKGAPQGTKGRWAAEKRKVSFAHAQGVQGPEGARAFFLIEQEVGECTPSDLLV